MKVRIEGMDDYSEPERMDDTRGSRRMAPPGKRERRQPPPPPPPPASHRRQRKHPEVIAEWELEPDEVLRPDEVVKKKVVRGKKQIILGLLIIGIIILAVSGLYYYILPRLDVEFITVYHEGTGGASSGGFINVNTKIANKGTGSLKNVNITIEILETETGSTVIRISDEFGTIGPGDEKEPSLNFLGDHYLPYTILFAVDFSSRGNSYEREYTYKTGDSDAMNQIFKDGISEWQF